MEKRPPFIVACVPYVNAIPLAMKFDEWGDASPVRVVYDVPSRLPALIESGEVQAALVSSIDGLRTPGRRIALGVCIGSHGPVKSVRLFSKVPPRQIRTLAHDASSLTSNRLAQIVLAERYGVRPQTEVMPPNLRAMLERADACVLIGDIGMAADGTGLHVLDLGEEWRALTGKPFVWAAWIGGDGLTGELAKLLLLGSAERYVGRQVSLEQPAPTIDPLVRVAPFEPVQEDPRRVDDVRERLISRARGHKGWDDAMIRDYFLNVMVYRFDEPMLEGLREFRRRLLANGFDECRHFPEIVEPAYAIAPAGFAEYSI